jgi:Uma2 family endonuclease
MHPGVLTIDGGRARLPSDIYQHGAFRAWARSDSLPEGIRIAFVKGEVLLEMSPESTESHNKPKGEISRAVWELVDARDIGEAYADRTLLTNVAAEISTEPDLVFASWATFESGRLKLVAKANRHDDYIELEGTPDLVVEIVSDTSARKDKKLLRDAYHLAGIREFWLVDASEQLSFQILRWTPASYQESAHDGEPQPSEVLGAVFALSRAKNRLDRWRYRLAIV